MSRFLTPLILLLALFSPGVAPGQDISPKGDAVKIFKAQDFGATPGANTDAGPALRRAIDAAKAAGPGAEVVLAPGRYRVGATVNPKDPSCFMLDGLKGVTIRGQGAATEIIVTDPLKGCFQFTNSDDVSVKNLAVDYDPLPFTQGLIKSVDKAAGTFDYEIQQGYPSLTEPYFSKVMEPYGKWGMIFDPKERRLKTGAPDFVFIKSWEPAGGRVFRMRVAKDEESKLGFMEPGDRFVHMARGNYGPFFFVNSNRCALEQVSVYSSPGLTVGAVGGEKLHVNGLQLIYRPGADRLLTSDCDGVHCQQNRGGPLIENSLFEGMADDGINIYYPPNLLTEVTSPTQIVSRNGGEIRVGDLLQIWDPQSGRIRAEVTALKVEDTAQGRQITLAQPVAGLHAGPDKAKADSVFNLSAAAPGFTIRNCIFRNHRRYGIFLKAHEGLVENNTIDRVGAWGIVIANDPGWPEGPVPRDIEVRGNTIKDVGFSQYYGETPIGAAIQIQTGALGPEPHAREVRGIHLSNNTIVNPPGAGIYLGSVRDVELVNTKITYTPEVQLKRKMGAVVLDNTAGVTITSLTVDSARPEVLSAIEIGPSVDPGARGVIVSGLKTKMTDAATTMSDRRK